MLKNLYAIKGHIWGKIKLTVVYKTKLKAHRNTLKVTTDNHSNYTSIALSVTIIFQAFACMSLALIAILSTLAKFAT